MTKDEDIDDDIGDIEDIEPEYSPKFGDTKVVEIAGHNRKIFIKEEEEQQKKNLKNALVLKEKESEAQKKQQDKLQALLKQMEEKVMHGGQAIAEIESEHTKKYREMQLKLKKQKKKEELLKLEQKEKEEEYIMKERLY